MKRSDDPFGLRKILADADLGNDAGAEKVLSELFRTPTASVEPPPGYENRLLSALHDKLPAPRAAPAREAETGGGMFGFLRLPQFAWGMTGVAMAALVLVSVSRTNEVSPVGGDDILVQTARKDPAAVNGWLASIGGRDRRVAAADIDLSGEDPENVDKALRAVARQMGMK